MPTAFFLILLFPVFPSFNDAWNAEGTIDPIVLEAPETAAAPMSDKELAFQAEQFGKFSDPAMRSRIAFDIGNSLNPKLFDALDNALTNEKDPAVRADIMTAIANAPVASAADIEKYVPGTFVKVEWKPRNGKMISAAANASFLPEQFAAKRVMKLGQKDPVRTTLKTPPVNRSATPEQLIAAAKGLAAHEAYNLMRLNPNAAYLDVLLKTICSDSASALMQFEACRAVSAQQNINKDAIAALSRLASDKFCDGGSRNKVYAAPIVRAAALMTLKKHSPDTYKKVVKELRKKEDDLEAMPAMLQDYMKQIEGAKPGLMPRAPRISTIQKW